MAPPDLELNASGRPRTAWELALSCPAARLGFALDAVEAHGIVSLRPSEILAFLDREAGADDHRSTLAWVDAILEGRLTALSDLAGRTERRDVATALGHLSAYRDQRNKLVRAFLDDVDLYADPVRYMKGVSRFPRPALRFQFIGAAPMEYVGDPGSAAGTGILVWEQVSDKRYAVRSYVSECPEDVDLQSIDDYHHLQAYTDAVMTGKVPDEDFAAVRRLFGAAGVTVFRV